MRVLTTAHPSKPIACAAALISCLWLTPVIAQICEGHRDCDDGVFCNGAELCRPSDSRANEQGCVQVEPPCLQGIRCDEDEDRCVREGDDCPDEDGDGYTAVGCAGGSDCDDTDGNNFPGNTEICDAVNHDEDCNLATIGVRDADGDGYIDEACYFTPTRNQ
jgi:hypothetical protein